jgi:gas vesicle protein
MADDRTWSARTAALVFLLGAALGAGAALLLAPQSGSESRQRLRGYARRTEDNLDEAADKAGEALDKTVDEGRGFMQKTTSA